MKNNYLKSDKFYNFSLIFQKMTVARMKMIQNRILTVAITQESVRSAKNTSIIWKQC